MDLLLALFSRTSNDHRIRRVAPAWPQVARQCRPFRRLVCPSGTEPRWQSYPTPQRRLRPRAALATPPQNGQEGDEHRGTILRSSSSSPPLPSVGTRRLKSQAPPPRRCPRPRRAQISAAIYQAAAASSGRLTQTHNPAQATRRRCSDRHPGPSARAAARTRPTASRVRRRVASRRRPPLRILTDAAADPGAMHAVE